MKLTKRQRSEYAKALSKLGASKGGKARKEALSQDERSAIAKAAAKARWSKKKRTKA